MKSTLVLACHKIVQIHQNNAQVHPILSSLVTACSRAQFATNYTLAVQCLNRKFEYSRFARIGHENPKSKVNCNK